MPAFASRPLFEPEVDERQRAALATLQERMESVFDEAMHYEAMAERATNVRGRRKYRSLQYGAWAKFREMEAREAKLMQLANVFSLERDTVGAA